MQFLYNKQAGEEFIQLQGENFNHLKVRRVKENSELNLRNLQDNFLYNYTITNLTRNSCTNSELNLRNLQDNFLYNYTITNLTRNSCT
ncbi:hypothetical protein F9666_07525, partial [Campylobacter jejuni]|nr:hypothetical protein [Campylobacter jejuni]